MVDQCDVGLLHLRMITSDRPNNLFSQVCETLCLEKEFQNYLKNFIADVMERNNCAYVLVFIIRFDHSSLLISVIDTCATTFSIMNVIAELSFEQMSDISQHHTGEGYNSVVKLGLAKTFLYFVFLFFH